MEEDSLKWRIDGQIINEATHLLCSAFNKIQVTELTTWSDISTHCGFAKFPVLQPVMTLCEAKMTEKKDCTTI